MKDTFNNLLKATTIEYLNELDLSKIKTDNIESYIESGIMEAVRNAFELRNAVADKKDKWHLPKKLVPAQIAYAMAKVHNICKIATNKTSINPDYDMLAIYKTDGYNKGTYMMALDEFRAIARRFDFTLSINDFKEVTYVLRDIVERKVRNNDKDEIAVNNGIFNYKTKKLEPFTPEKIFLSKSHVNYNPKAKNITIINPDDNTSWDIDSWMDDLSDNPEIVQLLWEILGAIIRPYVNWNKSAWFYSQGGNNGKGTLVKLMRNLVGDGSWASIPLKDFSENFALEPLMNASAILVDENPVGTYVDKADRLKAVTTNDVITINRKGMAMVAYQFYGFMVQCLNEYPKIKDKTDSFYRRQIFIPMDKSFEGVERKYIKDDYLERPEVLEYVLYKVLHMNYYNLIEPEECTQALSHYKEFNDPVLQFFNDVEGQLTWDLLPFPFLYELYKSWMTINIPNGSPVGRNIFINEIVQIVNKHPKWFCSDRQKKIRPQHYIREHEPLIAQYNIKDWMNPDYRGSNDIKKQCMPKLSTHYRGILRTSANTVINDDGEEVTILDENGNLALTA